MPGTTFDGREGGVLDLGEVVLRVAVQLHHADVDRRVVAVRPDLGQVEGVVRRLLGVELGHDLDLHGPLREVALGDAVVELLLVALAGLADDLLGLAVGQVLVALAGLEVELDPEALAGVVPERVGVAAVAVHEHRRDRDAAVRHEDGDLVQATPGESDQKSHMAVGRAQVGRGVALLGADEVGELERVADEEDRGVVADEVPVAFLGVELEREAAHVALGVGRALLAGDGGEAGEHRRSRRRAAAPWRGCTSRCRR